MAIRAKLVSSAAPSVITTPRVRTRPVIAVVQPEPPKPTLATWCIDIRVVDATRMFDRAVNVMKGNNKSPSEINARLIHSCGEIDIAECLKVLFEFMYRSVEALTECEIGEPQLYLEPLVPST